MKRFVSGCLILLLSVLTLGAFAQEKTSLPSAVSVLCETVYPGQTISAYSGWGDDKAGQFALILSQNIRHMLCIAEKAKADDAYRFVVENDKALREGEKLPNLLIDTGGDALFFSYSGGQYTYSYHASKGEDGLWGAVDLIRYDVMNHDEMGFMVKDDLLLMDYYRTDPEGNILDRDSYTPVPAPWLKDSLMLSQFDISTFPTAPYEAMDFGGKEAAAELLLPDGASVVDGGVVPLMLSLLADLPDGTRRLFLCTWDKSEGWQVTESSPLPANAYIDTIHSWSSMIVGWMEGAEQLSYSFIHSADGRWLVSYAMATDWFELREHYVGDPEGAKRYYGTFPEADLRTLDWKKLPRTFAQAVSMLETTGWARVTSDDPERRLHLRVSPTQDAKSLGKYYSGTPVRVLEEKGEWARVNVYGTEGWMMKEFLALGKDMPDVRSHYPSLVVRDELRAEGVNVYEMPNENAAIPFVYHSGGGATIIGVVGEEWFHVYFDLTGAAGYIRQECFWPGNG